MARTGALIVLTTKLKHPNKQTYLVNFDRSIACCLVSKRIPYIFYLWIYPERKMVMLGWRDVIYPHLRVKYTEIGASIEYSFDQTTISFAVSVGSNNLVKITTALCDISMWRYGDVFAPYILFNYIDTKIVSKNEIQGFKAELIDIEKNADLWNSQYEFAKLIDQLCEKYRL